MWLVVKTLVSGVDAEAQRKQTSGLWDGKVAALRWTFWRAKGRLVVEPKLKLWARKIHTAEWRRHTRFACVVGVTGLGEPEARS